MNSQTFRERFKDKLEKIQRDGSFKIKENYAILKETLPANKYHQIYRTESRGKYGKVNNPIIGRSIERIDSLISETIGNIPLQKKLLKLKSESCLNLYTQHSSQDHKKPNPERFQRKISKLPCLIPKLNLKRKYSSRPEWN
jgi:hypothetical protein